MYRQRGRKHPDQKFIEVDTSNILFIAGGAFDGIEREINKRLNLQAIGYKLQKIPAALTKTGYCNTLIQRMSSHLD